MYCWSMISFKKDILLIFSGILSYFDTLVKEDPSLSAAVAAIKTLLHFLENNKSKSKKCGPIMFCVVIINIT